MLLAQSLGGHNLLLRLVFGTKQSARQTTPRLFKNPRLTSRGYLPLRSRSFSYEIPPDTPNRHLYWNNTEMNRLLRRRYNANRLYKLGIRPIHRDGVRIYERTLSQILLELSNLTVLKNSLNRTLENMKEIYARFPECLDGPDKGILHYALEQINHRNLFSMSIYQFSTYSYLRKMSQLPPTKELFLQFYNFVEAETWEHKRRFAPIILVEVSQYIFQQQFPKEYKDLLYRSNRVFKLFEDNEPVPKSIEEMLPNIYTEEDISIFKADPRFNKVKQRLHTLSRIPGGQQLLEKLQSTPSQAVDS